MHFTFEEPGFMAVTVNIAEPVSSSARTTVPDDHEFEALSVLAVKAARDPTTTRAPTTRNAATGALARKRRSRKPELPATAAR